MLKATDCKQVRRIRVFVSSPNDVKAEICSMGWWTNQPTMGDAGSFVVQLFKRERNVIPQIDQTPQGVIDDQMPDCDVISAFPDALRHAHGELWLGYGTRISGSAGTVQ
jgi:hypothetical protein